MRELTCPTCQATMATKQVNGQDVEVCYSCISVWFEQGELRNHLKNAFGVELAKAGRVAATVTGPPRTCPECSVPMSHIAYDLNPLVTLDECPQCGGILAEHGELGALATHYQHAQEGISARNPTPPAMSHLNSSRAAQNSSARLDEVRTNVPDVFNAGGELLGSFSYESGGGEALADGGSLAESAGIAELAEASSSAFEGASVAADGAAGAAEASGGLLEFLLDLAGGLGDL